ncbi:MAG: ribosomal small subunit methyltransferase, partial [Actinomycetota bacterium]
MTLTRAHASDQLRDAGLSPRRALGQNFVVDANTVRRIAKLSGVGPGDNVIEIGAGLGSLTLALAETGANVTALEVDDSLVPLLAHNVSSHDNVRVVHADAMK